MALRSPGGDHHDMWIDPKNANRMIEGNDQGLGITNNRGETWRRVHLPIAQMYHVTIDNAIPYNVMGNRQDGPSSRGPSNSMYGGGIARGDWFAVGGGESGFATPDPRDPNVVWSSASGSGARGGIVDAHGRAQSHCPQRRGLAAEHGRLAGGVAQVPLPVDVPAARSRRTTTTRST